MDGWMDGWMQSYRKGCDIKKPMAIACMQIRLEGQEGVVEIDSSKSMD
jgi:hypothetical protein